MKSHCLKKKITLENPTFIPKIVFNESRVEKFICNFSKEREVNCSSLLIFGRVCFPSIYPSPCYLLVSDLGIDLRAGDGGVSHYLTPVRDKYWRNKIYKFAKSRLSVEQEVAIHKDMIKR